MFGLWFYKDAAPTALDGSKTKADGAHPQTGRTGRADLSRRSFAKTEI